MHTSGEFPVELLAQNWSRTDAAPCLTKASIACDVWVLDLDGDGTLDVVDSRTLKFFKRIPLSGRPNNVAVRNDGSQVYVGIREGTGAVDVIDAQALSDALAA